MFLDKIYNKRFCYFLIAITILISPLSADEETLAILEKLKKMLVLMSEDRKVVLSHHKTFEHVEKMRSIVNESIDIARE